MLDKFIDEVLKKVTAHNSKANHDSIPHSDIFEKEIQSLLGIDHPELERIIRILKDSHKLFTFEIIKDDPEKEVKRVDGYVETDLQTIRKLKNFFQKLLMDEYEKQYNKRLLFHQIVKDMYSRPQFYKNTLIGQIGNKAIMLDEYEGYIERNFNEFTDSWKTNKLKQLLEMNENKLLRDTLASPAAAAGKNPQNGESPISQRAVDSPQYQKYSNDKSLQSLSKVLQIYGVEFFFRINLRKYNFDLLTQIIESGEIDRRSDLILLRDMIQHMKENIGRDEKLGQYTDKIYRLERIISRQMLYSH